MTRIGFARLLALRGPDISSWPKGERGPALRLLRRSATARAHLLAAIEADPGIVAQSPAADTALVERLLAGTMRSIDAGPVSRRPRRESVTQPAIRWGALAACALLGIWVGWTAQSAAPPTTLLASVQLTPITDPGP